MHSNFFCSGFAVEDTQDRVIPESNGAFHGLQCGTEKGKHKCKNFRTAGIFVSQITCPTAHVSELKSKKGQINQPNFSHKLQL